MQREDQLRVKQLLSDAIKILCKNGLSYQAEFSIEGLLGITLDQKDIFLVNIKENVKHCKGNENKDEECEIAQAVGQLLTNTGPVSLADVADKDLDLTNLTSEVTTSGNKDIVMPQVIQINDDDEIDHENLNFNISDMDVSLKYNELDLFLSNFTGQKKSDSDNDEAPANDSIFSSLEIDQIINKANADQSKAAQSVTESDDEASDNDVVVVKQVGTRLAKKRKLGESLEDIQATVSVVAESPISISASRPDSGADFTKDLELPGCSSWPPDNNTTEYEEADIMPLNLTPVAQDLTTKKQQQKENGKPKKHMCDECGKYFKSENGMKKHQDKEHVKFVGAEKLVKDTPEPLNLIRQPLDLTVRSDLEEGELILTEGTHIELTDQETFTCVCRKEYSDYESYVEHATSCAKSKLTPYKSCETCGKYFFSSSGYIKHRRLHLGAYKFHCRLCHKGFFDRTHLGAHMDSSHNKVRRYECSHCVKRFFWKHHLKRHLATCGNARLGTSSIVKCEEPVDDEESLE